MAETPTDVERAQRLRHRAFIGARPAVRPRADGRDRDAFDPGCRHVLVEHGATGALVACFRMLELADGGEIAASYSAQHYALERLSSFAGPMIEMGRFCIDPDWPDPDILRVAWAALTRHVEMQRVEMLFGCSSFFGTDPCAHRDALAVLARRHLAPPRWQPGPRAATVFPFAATLRHHTPDPRRAARQMPPLLRSYLMMGGWVSDHAVIDTDLDTLHVFTGLEIGAISDTRKRLLRATAQA